jgi:Tfp pilus assembly protein PilN
MPIRPSDGKTAVALFVDGLELKFVRMSLKGGRIVLRDCKTVALQKKLDEKNAMATEENPMSDLSIADAFTPQNIDLGTEADGATNSSVLLGLLNELGSPKKYTLSYAISEPAVTYQELESNFALTGEKLKKRVLEELKISRTVAPPLDCIETIPTSTDGLLTLIREDGIQIYNLLSELKPFLGGRVPLVKLVESADVALLELVRSQYELQEEEVSVLVYVGYDFSRLIFMQGEHYLHFAPVISEGFGSPNIENTLYSRILLEQDNIALTRIDRILLIGESHKVNLRDSLAPQFSSAQVEYLQAPTIELDQMEESPAEVVSEYAIPILTAWKTLEPKNPSFYDINLIHDRIIEGQRVLAIAWHGGVVALLIIISIVYYWTAILNRATETRRANDELERLQGRLAELDIFRQRKDALTSDINRYSDATTVYDELAPGSDRWSRILHYIANSVEDLNSVWIYSIKPDNSTPGAIMISGRSIYRGRIPRLAGVFEKATLKEVRTVTIRKKVLYEFDILIEKVDKYDQR